LIFIRFFEYGEVFAIPFGLYVLVEELGEGAFSGHAGA